MRIFVDISETAANGLRTGIQRVVREVASRASEASKIFGIEIIPVIANGESFYPVKDIDAVLSRKQWLPSGESAGFVKKLKWQVLRLAKKILNRLPFLGNMARKLLYWYSGRKASAVLGLNELPANIGEGDVVLLLDSFWSGLSWKATLRARSCGASVTTMIYDLIPLSHPEFFDERNVAAFAETLPDVLEKTDHVLTISNFCAAELRDYCAGKLGISGLADRVDYIHLGSDFRLASTEAADLNKRLPVAFLDGSPVFIMVGTIEPRKNHEFVLDAFEKRWAEGGQEKLLWVGKNGWKVDALIQRANDSEHYGKRLAIIHDASDTELSGMMKLSSACIQASAVEGFGLPLVEAMQAGLPVLSSDIPVLREIGGDFPLYFSLNSPDNLVKALDRFQQARTEMAGKLAAFQWQTWDQASEKLYRTVIESCRSDSASGLAHFS